MVPQVVAMQVGSRGAGRGLLHQNRSWRSGAYAMLFDLHRVHTARLPARGGHVDIGGRRLEVFGGKEMSRAWVVEVVIVVHEWKAVHLLVHVVARVRREHG